MTKKNAQGAPGLRVPMPERVGLSSLQFAPYNPRTISKETMASLKASLVKHGMVLSLVVQRSSAAHGRMVLIGGHQRVRAMRELCKERGWQEPGEVPAVVLDVDDAAAKQLNVSLNNIEGDFDPYKLGDMFKDILPTMTSDEILATGFAAEEIGEMVRLLATPDEVAGSLESDVGDAGALTGFGASITLSLEFATVEARDEAKAILKAATSGTGHKPGDIALRAMKASKIVGKLSPRHKGVDAGKVQGRSKAARS